jgi:uncharacterized membrane protein YphA (DoxX/SURF4 family)
MNIALWSAQIVLAVVFLSSGAVKSLGSKEWLVSSGQTGVAHFSAPFIRFIAASEILGAAGLILPCALHVADALTPVAAACLATIMVGAATAHARLARENPERRGKERRNIGTNVVLLSLCLCVVVGRALVRG